METDRHLAAIEMDAAIMLAAATTVPMDTPVPSCPGWTMRDLIVHTGVVHRHKTAIVRKELIDGPAPQPPEPTSDEVQWFGAGVEEMLAVFRAADLDQPTWTWCTHDHAAEWWVRRMAHETAIHGADALLATGQTPALDHWLGLDGVDEVLDEMMVGAPEWAEVTELDGLVALRSEDREWMLRPATLSGTSTLTGKTYEDLSTLLYGEGEPDAVVEADPSTLDLWLWGRGELADDQIEGDASLVRLIREIAAESTQ